MIVGCDHIEAGTMKYFSHAIYSDTGGRSWKLGGSSPQDQVNECEVAELANGQLIMNMRNYDRSKKTRQIMNSEDGGLSWSRQRHDETLIEPICQASLLAVEPYLLFSNPASQDKREKMTVRLSSDDGKSWSESLLLHDGPAAYSDLTNIDQKKIGCLFEAGSQSAYEQIIFQQILLK
jgi:sialidase-1